MSRILLANGIFNVLRVSNFCRDKFFRQFSNFHSHRGINRAANETINNNSSNKNEVGGLLTPRMKIKQPRVIPFPLSQPSFQAYSRGSGPTKQISKSAGSAPCCRCS